MKSILCFLALTSCATPSTKQIDNFATIIPGVYRGAQPSEEGYKQLQALGVKHVLKLNSENLDNERVWAKQYGMDLIEDQMSGWDAPTDEQEAKAQAALDNPPVFVHCEYGKDRTGEAVAFYRVAHGWAPAAAKDEWYQMGHSHWLPLMDHYFDEKTEGK